MARLLCAVVAAVVVASEVLAGIRMYRSSGAGICGDQFLACRALSSAMCAIHCNQNVWCVGYSFQQKQDAGCVLHQTLTSPDGRPDATCFIPDTTQVTTTTSSTIITNITAAPATAAAPTIVPTDISQANRHDILLQSSSCHSQAGPIGIIFSTSHFLLCQASSTYKIFFSSPKAPCSSTNRIECMDITCSPGEIVVGFKEQSGTVFGPCAQYRSSVSVLDQYDCHTIKGLLQDTDQKESDWKTWRLCGGNEQKLYIMTAVHIVANIDGSWDYRSATCCRVKFP